MSRILEVVLPSRMGRNFRWLVAATWVSNLGDGIALAAGPLLVASLTTNPSLVALAAAVQYVPQLLFGIYAGAVADRIDRRTMTIVADLTRVLVLAVLIGVIATGRANIAIVIVAMTLLGVGETFADAASRTFLPLLVPREDLGIGNARLQAGFLTGNQLVGPPVGAFLFAIAHSAPFLSQAISCLLGVALISRIGTERQAVRQDPDTHIRRDIAEGLRWVWRHPPVRTLCLVILAFNVTWGAAWSVLVLWSLHHLHSGDIGYGLLTSAAAVGGIIGTGGYDWLERRVRPAVIMKVCLLCEVFLHLALALTTTLWLALVLMVGFGTYAFVWSALSSTLRQRAVPAELQGRVGGAYTSGVMLGLVLGQVLGGAIATVWGLTGPFWFAFVGAGLTLAVMWRSLDQVVVE